MNSNLVQTLLDLINDLENSNNHKPCMIIGPSAVGKDTMINKLQKKYPDKIYKLPSYTTRPIRENEKEGIDYYFVTHEEFDKMEKEGKLFGIQKYNNNKYASNKNKLEEALKNKKKKKKLKKKKKKSKKTFKKRSNQMYQRNKKREKKKKKRNKRRSKTRIKRK